MEGTIGEIRLFAASFAPRNWSYCNGALVALRSNTALFAILGTTYGGDGQNTFALPNLNGRSALSPGSGPGLTPKVLGESAGTAETTLNIVNLAAHTHLTTTTISVPAYSDTGNSGSASGTVLASLTATYSTDSDSPMKPFNASLQVGIAGSSQPLPIVQPSLGMNYIICMYGIFPSRS